jgi:sugar phosphate isomerase/epimerase
MNNSIGCNIIDSACNESDNDKKEVCLRNIEKYRRYGVTHLEFSYETITNEDDAKKIKDYALKIGIIPWSIHSAHLNALGKDELKEYLEKQKKCANVAAALGVHVCICHIPNIPPRAGNIQRDIEILTRLADITGSRGLKLAIETPPYDYIIELVDRIAREDVGINLDTGHTFLKGRDPAKVARAIGKRLFTTHLQDNFGENDDHQAPGIGKINWRETLKAIKETGYAGPFMLELTGKGVKAKRTVKQLREFELEKEIVFSLSYLNLLLNELK